MQCLSFGRHTGEKYPRSGKSGLYYIYNKEQHILETKEHSFRFVEMGNHENASTLEATFGGQLAYSSGSGSKLIISTYSKGELIS